MKKNFIIVAALAIMAIGATACSKTDKAKDTETVGVVIGEEMVMPEEGTDTSIVAEGVAVAVDTSMVNK